MVDARDSKSRGGNTMSVQVRPSAPFISIEMNTGQFLFGRKDSNQIYKKSNDMSCIFCRIISKELPSKIIAENDSILVIEDRAPRAPIHYLILSKKHVACLTDLKPEDSALMWDVIAMAQELASKIGDPTSSKESLVKSGAFNLIANNGAEAGQSVFHLHFHFIAQRNIYAHGLSL